MASDANKATNSVTLFANGMGHFLRNEVVQDQKRISIPFSRDVLNDVATSLNVFGNVKMTSPPSFNTINNTSNKFETEDVKRRLVKKFVGAKVNHNNKQYKLVGVQDANWRANDGTVVRDWHIILMDEECTLKNLESDAQFSFVEDEVRKEISKLLENNLKTVKQDTSLVEFTIAPVTSEAELAVVSFTIPVATYKFRYGLFENNGVFTLEGSVVADNNTDEDWTDCSLSVVTGSPISFATNIAEVVVPKRKMVSVVDNQVLGNVEVNNNLEAVAFAAQAAPMAASYSKMSRNYRNITSNNLELLSEGRSSNNLELAQQDEAISKDFGDLCVFTSRNLVNIPAKQSAVVSMFKALVEADVIYLYKKENHARRPYRAVRIKNNQTFTFGKGKVVVYENNMLSGESMMENTKPDGTVLLPHCLESNIRIIEENTESSRSILSMNIANKVLITKERQITKTHFLVENKKEKTVVVAIERDVSFCSDDGEISDVKVFCAEDGVSELSCKRYGDELRASFKIEPKTKALVTIYEEMLSPVEYSLSNKHWYSVVNQMEDLSNNPSILECRNLSDKIDDIVAENVSLEKELVAENNTSTRMRSNLQVAKGPTSENQWHEQLLASETKISEIQKKIKVNELSVVNLRKELNMKLEKLAVTWHVA